MIDLYSVMYNEERILPYFLRHYENIADRIFVWEDDSTDHTREILLSHPKVILLPMEKHGDNDLYWIAELFPQYEKHSRDMADWVMIADADEFIYHPDILGYLKSQKEVGTKLLQCQGYSMISDNFPTTNGQIYDEIKNGLPDRLETKWTVFSPSIWIRFKKGRHGRPFRHGLGYANRNSELKLLHYRYLGEDIYEERNRKNIERMEFAFRKGIVYHRSHQTTMPDGYRAIPLEWFTQNKNKAVNVVDDVTR